MILNLGASPIEKPAGDTLSERAAALVEADIVSGVHAPGSRLAIADLAAHYSIGATPVREGLSRLIARGLIVAIGQRGFRVSEISRGDLKDITRLRVLIECEALRESMERGDGAWEGAIVAALHRLRRYAEQNSEGLREGSPEFDALHKGFHTTLIAQCGSPRMLAAHSDLYDQAYRYRRIMMRTFEEGGEFVDSHRRLADLVITRQSAKAQANLAAHLTSTLALVYPETADRDSRGEGQ
ncbi:GntR family transcriptional regulator [Methylocapsa sp. S129]|uniref:GntR family transcriptional regulator n=1 Tax=Methylocapsa sp. S129 TaxID=1641869 RepID=UPI00131D7B0F|nr:FCD domain-containing protein [Methylocapsa sp. S129]